MLRDWHVCALVNNLTPKILKLNLGSQQCVYDEHVKTLVRRCNNITELDLSATSITNDSIEVIVKHLNSLEKLDLNFTWIDRVGYISPVLQFKSIPTLKILRCFYGKTEKIKNLKLQLPHISINEEQLHIACSTKEENGDMVPCWFWEIRAEEQDLFPKAQ